MLVKKSHKQSSNVVKLQNSQGTELHRPTAKMSSALKHPLRHFWVSAQIREIWVGIARSHHLKRDDDGRGADDNPAVRRTEEQSVERSDDEDGIAGLCTWQHTESLLPSVPSC